MWKCGFFFRTSSAYDEEIVLFGGDKMEENMFGFEITQESFNWENKRPVPPKGYIEFNLNSANCQTGKCPNCGCEKPGIGPAKRDGGFHDRKIQNLWRNLQRTNKKLGIDHSNWKPPYNLFSKDLFPEKQKYSSMIKDHPSRYGIDEFACCTSLIWHDFHEDLGSKGCLTTNWKYYYKPTRKDNNTLFKWF